MLNKRQAIKLAAIRWKRVSKKDRSKFASEIAGRITPEAAKARAIKAALTRKRNQKLKGK